jgi:hypothetical protein
VALLAVSCVSESPAPTCPLPVVCPVCPSRPLVSDEKKLEGHLEKAQKQIEKLDHHSNLLIPKKLDVVVLDDELKKAQEQIENIALNAAKLDENLKKTREQIQNFSPI